MRQPLLLTARLTPLLAAAALYGPAASGAIVFSEDFESDTPDTQPAGPDVNGDPYVITSGTNTSVLVRDDGAIGAAEANQYLQILDASTAFSAVFGAGAEAGSGGDLALQLDFSEPTGGGNGGFNLRLGSANANASAGPDLFFNNGTLLVNNGSSVPTLGTYSLDTTHSLLLSIDDDANTYDVTLDGVLIGDDVTFRNAVTISDLFFQVSSGNQQTFNVDNLVLSDSAAIPEPASLALLGLGGLLLMGRRRSA